MTPTTRFFIALSLGLGLSLTLLWLIGSMPVAQAANFIVTKFTDSNDGVCDADCSLREAIVAANAINDPDIITLMIGTYVLTLTGANENAAASGDLDITNPLTLTGAGAGLTFIDGGGLDRVLHTLTGSVVISGVTLHNGNASAGEGGGVFNAATLTLINTTISSNTTGSRGGGIKNDFGFGENMTLINSTVSNNRADGSGGGIYSTGFGNVILTNSVITNNTSGNEGGGINNDFSGNVALTNSAISSNTSANNGGGVYNVSATNMMLTNSVVSSNTAGSDGGGIANTGDVTLTNSTVSNNTAGTNTPGSNGGGISNSTGNVTLTNSTVSSNTARSSGGGIYSDAPTNNVTLINSVVSSNTARFGSGGGIANIGTVTLTNSVVSSNTANSSGGGGISNVGTVMLANSAISSNTAGGNGGGINNGGTVTLTHSAVSNNTARLGDGGGIWNGTTVVLTNSTVSSNTAGSDGGGIYNFSDGIVTLANSAVSNNTASSDGGGLYNYGDTINLTNSTISGNRVDGSGGGGYGYNLLLTHTTVASNVAIGGGGGIMSTAVSTKLKSSLLAYNSGGNCGGPITSNGYNLSSDMACPLTASGNLSNTNPLLGPLGNYGGNTPIHPLLTGSPAIDAADPATCPATDQRGGPRPQGGGCDIGAYEGGTPAPLLTIGKKGPASSAVGQLITYTLIITNSRGTTATGLVITDVIPAGANYVSGGTKVGKVVSWTVASLAANGGMTQVSFVVTATTTITNSNYRVSADGGYSATGKVPVVTFVSSKAAIYLPIVLKQVVN